MNTCMFFLPFFLVFPPLLLTRLNFPGITTVASNEHAKNPSGDDSNKNRPKESPFFSSTSTLPEAPLKRNSFRCAGIYSFCKTIELRSISKRDPETLDLATSTHRKAIFVFFVFFKSVSALVPEFQCRYTKHIF